MVWQFMCRFYPFLFQQVLAPSNNVLNAAIFVYRKAYSISEIVFCPYRLSHLFEVETVSLCYDVYRHLRQDVLEGPMLWLNGRYWLYFGVIFTNFQDILSYGEDFLRPWKSRHDFVLVRPCDVFCFHWKYSLRRTVCVDVLFWSERQKCLESLLGVEFITSVWRSQHVFWVSPQIFYAYK